MPNYSVVRQRVGSYGKAASLLPKLKQVYQQCQEIDDAITLYQAGTDTDFRDAINAIYSAPERAQLAAMLTNVEQLVTLWTAQHSDLLTFDEQA